MNSNVPKVPSNPIQHDVIPPTHSARTLVLCFDGTNDYFANNSNIVQFFSALLKNDKTQQKVYYQTGIGTYTIPQFATPVMAKLSEGFDSMFAWNLGGHIMDGYLFLMQNYNIGDKICIFGFSRGAYTARALAGMVHKVGLLPSSNYQQVPFAYKMFTRKDDDGRRQSIAFKKAFSMDVGIEFVGVWDTVSSVGVFPHHRIPFTSSNSSIKTFRHAISLDEHRVKFKVNFYNRPTKEESQQEMEAGEMPKSGMSAKSNIQSKRQQKMSIYDFEGQSDRAEVNKTTNVLEVWFAGCHTDVGGGSADNENRHNLARIPLRWMIRECFKANTGIRFHAPLLAALGIDPATLHPEVLPRPPAKYYEPPPPSSSTYNSPNNIWKKLTDTAKTLVNLAEEAMDEISGNKTHVGYGNVAVESIRSEEEEDLEDALCPLHDELKIAPWWWFVELIPMSMRVQRDEDDGWDREITWNFGYPRIIPRQDQEQVKVHRSVKIRLEAGTAASGGQYVPKAKWRSEPKWED